MSKTGKGLVLRIVAIFLLIILALLGTIFLLYQENKELREELSRCQWDKKDAQMVQRRLTRNLSLECPQPKCPEPDVRCPKLKCPECDQSILKEIIENHAEEHKYQDNDRYDCTQFADELARRLEDTGFDADARTVTVDCERWREMGGDNCKEYDGRHRIVEVDDLYIEATRGKVIHPQNYEVYGLG